MWHFIIGLKFCLLHAYIIIYLSLIVGSYLYSLINWKVESNHFFQDANFCANQLATHKVDYEEL